MPCRHQIVQNGQAGVQFYVLKGPGDAQLEPLDRVEPADILALKKYVPLLRMVEPGNAVDERRLPGSVRADEGQKLPVEDVHVNVVQNADAAERQGKVLDGSRNGFFDRIRLNRHGWLFTPYMGNSNASEMRGGGLAKYQFPDFGEYWMRVTPIVAKIMVIY